MKPNTRVTNSFLFDDFAIMLRILHYLQLLLFFIFRFLYNLQLLLKMSPSCVHSFNESQLSITDLGIFKRSIECIRYNKYALK